MSIDNIISESGQAATQFIQQFLPDVPAEAIRFGGAAFLAATALLLLIFALRMLKSGKSATSHSKRVNIPRALQRDGVVIDLLNSPADDEIAARCVITSVSAGKIHCELIERLDVIRTKEGAETTCVFAPMKIEDSKINSFNAKLVESDKTGRKTDRIILSVPTGYNMIPRRKHTRKKVADQQFIRVKLWITDPRTSDICFEDAAPHISVNSLSSKGPSQSANAVVNISNGGLGLSIVNRVLPETCAVGAKVAINLFMFNFREKSFKPYWYSAEVRSMGEGRPGYTRMGIEFDGFGNVCGKTGKIQWDNF